MTQSCHFDLKLCFKCQRELPRSEFYAHRMMADGLLGKCKRCAKLDVRANYQRRRDHYIAYDRARNATPKRIARITATIKANPKKHRARVTVHNAIRRGKLQKLPCHRCGHPKAEAHHHDYTKPLDIEWLCRSCHHREHFPEP